MVTFRLTFKYIFVYALEQLVDSLLLEASKEYEQPAVSIAETKNILKQKVASSK